MNKVLSRLPRPVAYALYLIWEVGATLLAYILATILLMMILFVSGLPVVAIMSNFVEVGYGFGLLISTIVVGMPVVYVVGAIIVSIDFEAERCEFEKLYTPRKRKE